MRKLLYIHMGTASMVQWSNTRIALMACYWRGRKKATIHSHGADSMAQKSNTPIVLFFWLVNWSALEHATLHSHEGYQAEWPYTPISLLA